MNNNSNLIYGITDTPKKWYEWPMYALQMVMSVFVATILIAQLCGTPIDACLIGGAIGTLIYQLCTRFKSPMFISNSGATVSAVIGALVIGSGLSINEYTALSYADKLLVQQNYFAVFIGGLIILAIYGIFALIVKLKGPQAINKIFPPTIVGPVTIVIGLNLAKFIFNYTSMNANGPTALSNVSLLVAIFTMIIIAIVSKFAKGFSKTIPFLIGLISGFVLSIIITLTTNIKLVDFSIFKGMHLFRVPSFSFLQWGDGISKFSWGTLLDIMLLFIPVTICAMLEHYSDHKVLSNILEKDLTVEPGLDKTLLGDGLASAVGTAVCGLPNTSYGESIATIGFSKVASVKIVTVAAVLLGSLAFLEPFQLLIQAIPQCVFGGCAMVLYGYIASSGLKTMFHNKVDLENSDNLIITSVILTVGVSGVFLFSSSFVGTSLAMILGVILNLLFNIKRRQKQ